MTNLFILYIGGIVQKIQRTTKTFLENWLQKTVKQYVVAMNGRDDGKLHDLILSGVEKPLIEMVLSETGGNQTQAASILGINRNTLRKKIKDYDLK
ncbi:MAG TPA: helix-turn-helix domain-containing protein [Nitrospinaceae bacterium]|nr:helix-turn-helix domain-containing protein [Nitrospinaceae bacterium]